MTPDDRDPAEHESHPDATPSEPEANPMPPAEDAVTADDVHDTPQLPPKDHRDGGSDDG